ncbi:hypothetical protein PPTG_14958 [Phytophthora nicotianae INRA-310]|uniref:Uncharacterized protein n=1 Tax=Phytophthora nicotianae (strain INRA-310) TaxID=761204 RepID=W2PTH3_PHYN3|nr:hypothetical protein PPTG_14958 [Phytophthora nicotianae INRA-310]ETN04258.1 hypothetical protein PPTG_14958 [Phytophthora nicotianae INRA-310]
MYRELTISSGVPAHKLRKAFKTGKLSLTAAELKGSDAKLHLHPESHEKALKAKEAGRGVCLHITRHDIKNKAADAAVPALATALGQPELAVPASAGLKTFTGVGLDGYDSEEEGGRISIADERGILTDIADAGERYLVGKSNNKEHHDMIHQAVVDGDAGCWDFDLKAVVDDDKLWFITRSTSDSIYLRRMLVESDEPLKLIAEIVVQLLVGIACDDMEMCKYVRRMLENMKNKVVLA